MVVVRTLLAALAWIAGSAAAIATSAALCDQIAAGDALFIGGFDP